MTCHLHMLSLLIITLTIINKSVADDVASKDIKVPKPVNISGIMFCNYVRAYAVLINIVEEVSCLFFNF
ncbi:unnamed protein product [Onchocerca flexuosa]|uniref:Secreted protein n=1 Tax=Onchocerca flexuosa TaxID=387005 RepID=A0A183HWQ8_9BILA|nr:unnamed protein product [Onchocerca flexuosa]